MTDGNELDDSSAPLIEHLAELRTRVVRAVLAFGVGMIAVFPFAQQVLAFLAEPMAEVMRARGETPELFFDAPQDAFFAYIKISMLGGLAISFPIIAYQLWRFVAPGLYAKEKGAFLPFMIASPLLFLTGGAFAHFVVTPLAMQFFLSFDQVIPALTEMLGLGGDATEVAADVVAKEESLRVFYFGSVKTYLALSTKFIVAFGLCFQLPVLLTLMGKAGLVTSRGLKDMRKYAVVGILLVAAVVTPPDVVTQVILFTVVYALYEISIHLVRSVENKREAQLKADGLWDPEFDEEN